LSATTAWTGSPASTIGTRLPKADQPEQLGRDHRRHALNANGKVAKPMLRKLIVVQRLPNRTYGIL
jgi:hypothetical protein